MKRKTRNDRFLPLLLLLAMLLSLAACGSTGGSDAQGETPSGGQSQSDSGVQTRTITDGVGRTVEIPAQVERIVPLGNAPRMAVYLGLADRIVGIEDCEIAESPIQAYAYPYIDAWSALPVCGTNSMGETAYYPEEIMLADPDVILCTDPADTADNLQSQTGIPVVSVPQGTLFGEDYEEALRILGDVCGVSDRAEAVIAFIQDCLADLERRVENIPQGDKPTVLAAGATFKGGHSIDGIYTDYPVFQILSANDAAKDVAGEANASGVMVDKEQILSWDPEIIFFDAGSMELVRTDYAENPGYFEQLRAVREGNLYQWPNSTWHWSNVEIPLVSAYSTGILLYPEAFADVDFAEKASEIFDFFLGEPDFLSTLEAAGAGYGNVTLGE